MAAVLAEAPLRVAQAAHGPVAVVAALAQQAGVAHAMLTVMVPAATAPSAVAAQQARVPTTAVVKSAALTTVVAMTAASMTAVATTVALMIAVAMRPVSMRATAFRTAKATGPQPPRLAMCGVPTPRRAPCKPLLRKRKTYS